MWVGPLPYHFCRITITIRMVLINTFIFILLSIVITKFMYICVWKTLRNSIDELLTKIVIRCSFTIALIFCLIRATVQEKMSFLMVSIFGCPTNIQLLISDYIQLLNKPYVNGVTLREQNQPLKYCQPLDFWYTSLKGLDLSLL